MLIGNRSVLHKSPVRFINGREALLRSNFSKHGMIRNAAFDAKSAIPYGHLSPSAWVLPKTAGGMSSRNVAVLSVSVAGSGASGFAIDGVAAIVFTVPDAEGRLVTGGTGTASMVFSTTGDIFATLGVPGTASFSITTNTPILKADGFMGADAPFVITGEIVSYAKGFMSGSTVDSSVLTTDALIAAMNSNPPSVNVKKVNDVAVTGTGATGDEWGP